MRLFRYTVDYMKDAGVTNFLYSYSPNAIWGGSIDEAHLLKWYPGDDYVDIIGLSGYASPDLVNYPIYPKEGRWYYLDDTEGNVRVMQKMALERGKIATFSEFGINASVAQHGFASADHFNFNTFIDLMIENNMPLAFALTWGNGEGGWMVPYRANRYNENHPMMDEFIRFYNHEKVVFADRLDGVYTLFD